jgi:hypothetical protein
MGKRSPGRDAPDADTRRALLLILTVLERHSRALRTLLAKAGRPELEGLLGGFARRERALREIVWRLRALAARDAAGPANRRRGTAAVDLTRQGVLPLPEATPNGARRPGLASGLRPNGTEDGGGAAKPRGARTVSPLSTAPWGVGRTSWGREIDGERPGLDDQGRERRDPRRHP